MEDKPTGPDIQKKPPKAGPIQVALAIFWSFFGVRKSKNWQDDAARFVLGTVTH